MEPRGYVYMKVSLKNNRLLWLITMRYLSVYPFHLRVRARVCACGYACVRVLM